MAFIDEVRKTNVPGTWEVVWYGDGEKHTNKVMYVNGKYVNFYQGFGLPYQLLCDAQHKIEEAIKEEKQKTPWWASALGDARKNENRQRKTGGCD